MTRIEIANQIAERIEEARHISARVWAPKEEDGIIRVYIGKRGYCQVEQDGVNIDAVNGSNYSDVKEIVQDLGIEAYRR